MAEKTYTISQVIEVMEFGEVAVKVDGMEGEYNSMNYGEAIYFDEKDDGVLKTVEGREVSFCKASGKRRKDEFVIMDRKVFDKINK